MRIARRGRALGVSLGLGALLAVPAAVPTSAGAATCAPSLGRVKAFVGHANLSFFATATGVDPGEGGAETIILSHHVHGVRIYLHKAVVKRKGTDFVGTATQGEARVADSLVDTGSGFGAQQNFSGPLTSHRPNYGLADLVIDRRKHKCRYQFLLGVGVNAAFSGDEEIQAPIPHVFGSAYGSWMHIPGPSLKLVHTDSLIAVLSCENNPLVPEGCYEFSGGWMTDFATLFLCHSVEAVNCADDKSPITTASFEWSLSPVYEKKK